MCPKSLNEWAEKLSAARDDENLRLTVIYGTKGDRPRDVFIQPDRRDEALQIVEQAREIVQKNIEKSGDAFLVVARADAKVQGIEGALKKVENAVRHRGFVGSNSQHGIRRDFAQKNYHFYREEGLSDEASKMRTSADLGHGRTDIISGHYLNGGEG